MASAEQVDVPSNYADTDSAGNATHRKTMKTPKTLAELQNGEEKGLKTSSEKQKGGPWFLVICFLGIFISYFIYGLLQEKITKRKFGDEYFRFFLFMIAIQCFVNSAFARIVCAVRGTEASLQPHFLFSFLAFTYVGAMVASNVSLSYVSYPTQVLGKSAKPIPILVLGVLIVGKVYPRIKYFIVVLIVAGVALFFYKDGGDQDNGQAKLFNLIGFGEALIILSLVLDGLTGITQDSLRTTHNVSAHHMMYAVNAFATVYLSVGVVVTGELWRVSDFIQEHPIILLNIAVFSIASSIGQVGLAQVNSSAKLGSMTCVTGLGRLHVIITNMIAFFLSLQNFIFLTVTHFGPLTTSIITTTRKFFTILASVLLFGNPLLPRQWVGVVMVFFGLGIDAYFGKASRH